MTSNDEMERIKFAKWFEGNQREQIKDLTLSEQLMLSTMAWFAWQAALKSKQGEV